MSKLPVPTEDAEQAALFAWAARAACTIPELNLLYAIANGGYRNKATAARLKLTGVKAGVPDICLPVARGGYNALYLEMKRREGGRVSEPQKRWLSELKLQGCFTVVCEGWGEAAEVITGYLGGEYGKQK